MLDFTELRLVNVRRLSRWHGEDDDSWTGADWSNAMCGESGEAANVVKKLRRVETGVDLIPERYDKDELRAALAKELADTVIYADLLANYYGIDLGDAVVSKFNEVSDRYGFPEKLLGIVGDRGERV